MAQASRSRGGLYNNPDEMGMNPRVIYPDGIIEGFTNPLWAKTYRPRGSLYPTSSDFRKTITERRFSRPGGRRMVRNRGFARDITGKPWASTQPEWLNNGGPSGPVPVPLAHDPGPDALSDPRNKYGLAGQVSEEVGATGTVTDWTDIRSVWHQLTTGAGPVATVFFLGAGALVVGGLLGIGPLKMAGTSTGRVAGAAGAGVGATGGSALDGLNSTLGKVTESVNNLTPGS